jgi:hypothetical protein
MLLYGCEIWSFGNNDVLEKVHLKFCKLLLNLKQSTPRILVFRELGRYPLDIHIKTRIINFWANIVNGKETKLSYLFYQLMYKKHLKVV